MKSRTPLRPTRRNAIALGGALLAGILLFASADNSRVLAQPATNQPLGVALLTNGPLNDWGFNYTNDIGLKYVKEKLGNKVNTQAIGEVPETGDAERIMRRLIDQGNRLIIAASYGYHDTTKKLAAENPKVSFLQVFGDDQAKNLGTYGVAMYQPWYVMGGVAGSMTKTNKLGVVIAHPIPPLKWYVNVFQMGARSVNPNATVTVTSINHWFDQNLAAEATEALIASNHDVVTGLLDNMVAIAQTAEKRRVWVISQSTGLQQFAPNSFLVGTEFRWG